LPDKIGGAVGTPGDKINQQEFVSQALKEGENVYALRYDVRGQLQLLQVDSYAPDDDRPYSYHKVEDSYKKAYSTSQLPIIISVSAEKQRAIQEDIAAQEAGKSEKQKNWEAWLKKIKGRKGEYNNGLNDEELEQLKREVNPDRDVVLYQDDAVRQSSNFSFGTSQQKEDNPLRDPNAEKIWLICHPKIYKYSADEVAHRRTMHLGSMGRLKAIVIIKSGTDQTEVQ